MPKQTTKTPPPARDPIETRSRTHMSTSGEQTTHCSNSILGTPFNEQRIPSNIYILASPILGPITVEQILKGNFDNIAKIRRRFDEGHL